MEKISILLAEDDETNLASLKGYFEAVGDFVVTGLKNSKELLKALESKPEKHNVLIVDWTLRPIGGEELLSSIKKQAPELPVIVFTGNAEAGAEAYQKGAYAYFRKPVNKDGLVQTIKEAVSRANDPAQKTTELTNINTLLIEKQTPELFASAIISKANSLVGSTAGCFYMWNWSQNDFIKLAQAGCADALGKPAFSNGILKKLKNETDILTYPDKKNKLPKALQVKNINSQAFVLLRRADLQLGLLVLGKESGVFTDEDEKILSSLKTMVEPLLEQIKVKELLKTVDLDGAKSEADLSQSIVYAVYESLGRPTALWLIARGYDEYKIQTACGVSDAYKKNAVVVSDSKNSCIVSAVAGAEPFSWTKSETSQQFTLPDELEGFGGQGAVSMLTVPLLTSENAVLGAIVIYGKGKNDFKEYDIQMARDFGAQASKTLENLRRQWQSNKLVELSNILVTKSQSEAQVFSTFADAIYELTGACNVAVYPYDPKRQIFFDAEHVIIRGEKSGDKKISETPREKGLAYIVRHVEKIIVDDVDGSVDKVHVDNLDKVPGKPRITKPFLKKIIAEEKFIKREQIRAFAGISLRAFQSQAEVGVMYVNYKVPHSFVESEINALQIAARQLASVIQSRRAWDYQQLTSKALKEIIDVIGTNDSLSSILEQTARLFAADHGSISRLTENGQDLIYQAIWVAGSLERKKEDEFIRRSINKGITGHVVRTGEPFHTGNVSQVSFYDGWYPSTKSELTIPLKNVFGGVVGVLNLESNFADFFTDEHEKLCVSFANAASAAIQQSDLLDDINSLHAVTEEHNLNELLIQVLKNLNKMMGANTALSINLYDKDNDNFYSFCGVGPDDEFVNKYLLVRPRKDGTGRFVLTTGKPLYYPNVGEIPDGLPKIRAEAWDKEIRSFAVLPLIHQGEILGALFIHKIKEQIEFMEDVKRILETYATQAALVVHNARRRVNVDAIKELLDATVSGDQEKILNIIVRRTVSIMSSDYASIWLGVPETGDLRRDALYVTPEEEDNLISGKDLIKSGQPSINMMVYETREPAIVPDVEEEQKKGNFNRIYKNAKSEITVPLIFQDNIIGTLNTESKRLSAFSEFDLTTLRLFADIAAKAIFNAKSYDQRIKDITALQEINRAIGQKSLPEIYELIAQKARELTHATYSTLWLLDTERKKLMVGAVSGRDARADSLPLNEKSVNGHVATTRKPYICIDTRNDKYYHLWYDDILSNLAVPIVFRDQVIGTLDVESTQKLAYNKNNEELLQSLADQIAIAIKLAQTVEEIKQEVERQTEETRKRGEELYHMNFRLERKNASFEALTEIGQQLTANVQYGERQILSIIHQQASRIMDTGNMYIALYEPERDEVHFELAFIDGVPVEITDEGDWRPRSGGNGRTEWIIRNKMPILTYTKADANEWYEQPDAKNYIGQTFASWLGVPIMFGDEVLGVIATYHITDEYKYSPDDERILSLMGRQAAIALQNARLINKLNAMRELGEDLSSALSG